MHGVAGSVAAGAGADGAGQAATAGSAGRAGHAGGVGQTGAGGAGGAAGDGSPPKICGQVEPITPRLGLATVPLNGAQPARLTESVPLLGEGLERTLSTQENAAAGLRWEHDRMFMLADRGFWDLSEQDGARWYGTSSTLVLAVRAADVDADDDQDLLLLTVDPNPEASSDPTASPLLTRLAAWERSAEGLAERAEILTVPNVILPIPYQAGDLDGDGDLEVVAYERGTPVVYMHDGAYGFTRTVVGPTAPEYEDQLLAFTYFEDRNQDGARDLLVATGEALEISAFVLMADGGGRFGAPGPATIVEATLVPHGPIGTGFGVDDVTGDGLADIVTQDAQSSVDPVLNLFVSEDATRIASAVPLEGLGFEFADVDGDEKIDIVTTRNDRLVALLSRGAGAFEALELGIPVGATVVDFGLDPGANGEAVLYVLYDLSSCSACEEGCSGRCVFGACVDCLSDADCASGRCEDHACAP